jgi:hypothetical protein
MGLRLEVLHVSTGGKKTVSASQIHCHIIQIECSTDPPSSKIIYVLMFCLYSLLEMHYYMIKKFSGGTADLNEKLVTILNRGNLTIRLITLNQCAKKG